MNDTPEPLLRFASTREELEPAHRVDVLALGASAIAHLLRFIEDERLQREDSPKSLTYWSSVEAAQTAARLLREAGATSVLDAGG